MVNYAKSLVLAWKTRPVASSCIRIRATELACDVVGTANIAAEAGPSPMRITANPGTSPRLQPETRSPHPARVAMEALSFQP